MFPNPSRKKKFKKYGKTLKGAAKAIWEFNKTIIDEIHDICPAIKPQAAYYEMYGYEGVKTLYKTIQYAKRKRYVRHDRRQEKRYRRNYGSLRNRTSWSY